MINYVVIFDTLMTSTQRNDSFWLSTIVILITLLSCIVNHHMDLRQRMVGAQMRIACSAAIYRKTLRMSKRATSQTSAGNVVNLLSNDVGRLDYGFIFIHFIWILPIQACLICYLIWREVKYAAVVGVVGLLLKTVPIQTGLSKVSSILRMRVAKRTDDRVSIMNELIQGIQVIKMYAWETPFRNVVKLARKKEIDQIQWASYIRGIYLSTMVFTERSTLFIAIIACIFEERPITADLVFSMATFFNVLQLTAAIFYPLAVSLGAEALVSFKRIQDFLMLEEQDPTTPGLHQNEIEIMEPESNVIEVINVNASWTSDYKSKTLSDLNMKIKSGKLCAIVGSVGSGKSSILQLLLGELPIYSGDVLINGDISYGSQESWLFSGTVRNNILFGLPYDKARYQETIKHCALLTDLQQLPHGDKTFVGERGSALSGGQRARVSLARAVYKNASIYLLDDPLSAVDSHVGKHLFDECIGPNGYLAKQRATRILVTHQVHLLQEADWIVVMNQGGVLRQGTYNDVMDIDLTQFISPVQSEDDDLDGDEFKEEIEEDEEDIPYIDDAPGSSKGYLKLKTIEPKKSVSRTSIASSVGDISVISNENEARQEEKTETKISFYKVFWLYFRAGANVSILFSILLFLIFSQVVTSGSDYFITFWTNQEFIRLMGHKTFFTTTEGLYIYGFLILAVVAVTLSRGFIFFAVCMRSSKKLHDKSFLSLLHSPMRFFDTNPSGRILNRFSKDMGAVDELLPKAIIEATQNLLVMSGILILIAITTSGPWFLISLGGAVLLYVLILKLYLQTAQDLKRLEGITKSPVFSQMAATLKGISTIRACKASKRLTIEFDNLQNVHSSVWQILMSVNAALGLWLDIVSCGFVACVCFSFIILSGESTTSSSSVGLAISQALILTGMVQYGIRQAMESFQLFTNTERVLQYTRLEQEPLISRKPTRDWPFKGLIEFKNMSLYYDVNIAPALKNLNMTIEPGMKIGIVGRTGAGKSSIINALFRLSYIDGRILIDGIDTSEINLESLRSKISIIPQDPVLFSATIRYNLDPFNVFQDDQIWKALEVVEMKTAINGLQFMVTEGGSNFSVGERQLLCLARSLVRNNKILLLDEATANIDQTTDALIQKTIREKFSDCTVLTIAHRLHTIMDSDMVLVMENGYAKEYDVPYKLLQQPFGIFRGLVNNLGQAERHNLTEIAKLKYDEIFSREAQPKNIWKFKDI
ncbi:CLUMA_CG012571, isoform A [Clunio marinus]|uniref:CLUMA_CG012571, isoform A n=1 Tax=Clunio marinus TaxID=568069 RepID=A0A1J1IJR7_9DIPT|nr:CLUMA_CG012571, isoform A [Clunio marinus]